MNGLEVGDVWTLKRPSFHHGRFVTVVGKETQRQSSTGRGYGTLWFHLVSDTGVELQWTLGMLRQAAVTQREAK